MLKAILILCTLPLPVVAEVAGMPLAEGYYAEQGASCAEGNDATLGLLHQGGFNNSYGLCAFEAVTPQGDGSFSYAATCRHPEQEVESLDEGVITPKGKDSFLIYNGVMRLSYEFCPPASLPPPYGG